MRHTLWLGGLLVVTIVCFASMTAIAQTLPPPVRVLKCDPQPPNVVVPGFVPGFYPAAPYFWYDVYGYRYLQPPIVNDASLSIDYINISPKVAHIIEFGLIARGALVAESRDVGTFSPNVEIKHQFGLNPNVFPLGTALPRCPPLRVTFMDGTKWVNPHLPALRRAIYHR